MPDSKSSRPTTTIQTLLLHNGTHVPTPPPFYRPSFCLSVCLSVCSSCCTGVLIRTSAAVGCTPGCVRSRIQMIAGGVWDQGLTGKGGGYGLAERRFLGVAAP